MRRPKRPPTTTCGLLAVWLLAACAPSAPTAGRPTPPRPSVGAVSPAKPNLGGTPAPTTPARTGDPSATPPGPRAALTPPPGLAPGLFLGAGVLSNNGAGVLANNGGNVVSQIVSSTTGGLGVPRPGTLAGVVKVPPALITDNGGGVVANNGAALIGNNGAGVAGSAGTGSSGAGVVGNAGARYRLQALDAVPYAGAAVYLLDAKGQPLVGQDQLPVVARTDAEGRYRFEGDLDTGSNYLVVVSLPGERGQLGAIAPRGAARRADVDLVSTLTTGYILDRYVAPQADKQRTLDKLPADVEATTRAKAEAALVAGPAASGATPLALVTREAVGELVDRLRGADKAFDAQMDEVRRLLVAGQSDMGVGKPATEVALPWIRGVVPTDDGGFYLNAAVSGRVFKVGPDRKLVAWAGNAAGVDQGSPDGKPAAEFGFGTIHGLLPDEGDRLVIAERQRLTRREADGTLKALWPQGAATLYAAGRAPEGAYWVLASTGCFRVTPGAAPVSVRPLAAADLTFLKSVKAFGQDGTGRLVLAGAAREDAPLGEIRAYDPATGVFETLVAPGAADVRGMAVDAFGRVYLQGTDGAIRVRGDGQDDRVVADATHGVTLANAAVGLTVDDGLLWALIGAVHQVGPAPAGKQLVAGKLGVAVDADGQIALNRPGGLLAEPDGALVLAVAGDNQVVRLRNGTPTVIAGTGAADRTGDGGPATAATLANPTALERDGAGAMYVLDAGRAVRRIAPDGTIATVHAVPADPDDTRIFDCAVTKDGKTLFVTGARLNASRSPVAGYVSRVDLDTKAETPIIAQADSPSRLHVIALDGQDRLHVVGGGQLRRWDGATGFTTVKEDPALMTTLKWSALGRAAFDPAGRLWFFTGEAADRLDRLDLATGVRTTVAGRGAALLGGEGVDDSIANGMGLAFGAAGEVFFCDVNHLQVKRIPANAP